MRVAFVAIGEDELLAYAKAHIAESDCENHCRHYRRPNGNRTGRWDPTSCPRFKANERLWCDGYEQVEHAAVRIGGER